MAAPEVSGAVALLRRAKRELIGNISKTESYLTQNAAQLTSTQACELPWVVGSERRLRLWVGEHFEGGTGAVKAVARSQLSVVRKTAAEAGWSPGEKIRTSQTRACVGHPAGRGKF